MLQNEISHNIYSCIIMGNNLKTVEIPKQNTTTSEISELSDKDLENELDKAQCGSQLRKYLRYQQFIRLTRKGCQCVFCQEMIADNFWESDDKCPN
jgi:hypothetical protein